MKFLSPEVAMYLYKFTIQPCMEYCYHVWAGALLDKLQKQICRTAGPLLLEPSTHHRNVASLFFFLSLFYRYYFGRCSPKLAQLISLPYSRGLLSILIESMIFLSPLLDVTRMSMSTVSFLTQLDSATRMLSFDL